MSIVFKPGKREYVFDGITVIIDVPEPGVDSKAVAEMLSGLEKANPEAVRKALKVLQAEASEEDDGESTS